MQQGIQQNGVFSRRADMKKKYGDAWQDEFKRLLKGEGWSKNEMPLLIKAKTPRAFAIYKGAEKFNRSYDWVDEPVGKLQKRLKNSSLIAPLFWTT